MKEFVNNIFSVREENFTAYAIHAFRYQYEFNIVYKAWVDALSVQPHLVESINHIPFLPVSFFKTHQVTGGTFEPKAIFESSGTTNTINSKHIIRDIDLYKRSFVTAFRSFYGNVEEWCIIGLLPSYIERTGSSLVMMVDELIKLSTHRDSGFYLYEFEKLATVLQKLEDRKQRTLLIGVTFALLDFAEQFPMELKHTVVMETGGLKGRRKELIRDEVHSILKKTFHVDRIHSEYGMTELLSQAYSDGDGVFRTVPWMKILLRDEEDPLTVKREGRGLINVIDLANIHSCSFIATDDVGVLYPNGNFEVLGRFDNSDLRGCSLLTEAM